MAKKYLFILLSLSLLTRFAFFSYTAETVFELDRLRAENTRLKNLLGFKAEIKEVPRGARVLLYMQELGKEFLLIDQGMSSGIFEGMRVVDSQGFFVGTVRELGETTAKVVIGSNLQETHDGELLPLGVRVIVKGRGARTLALELVQSDLPVREGDFVTLFARDLSRSVMMAEVTRVRREVSSAFQTVSAVLLARPDSLREVYLLEPVK